MPSFTERTHGQLKSMITLLSSESRFSTVFRGEASNPGGKGTVSKGPTIRPSFSSLDR